MVLADDHRAHALQWIKHPLRVSVETPSAGGIVSVETLFLPRVFSPLDMRQGSSGIHLPRRGLLTRVQSRARERGAPNAISTMLTDTDPWRFDRLRLTLLMARLKVLMPQLISSDHSKNPPFASRPPVFGHSEEGPCMKGSGLAESRLMPVVATTRQEKATEDEP